MTTSTFIKYEVERDKRYLPYIELGRWLTYKTTMDFCFRIIRVVDDSY